MRVALRLLAFVAALGCTPHGAVLTSTHDPYPPPYHDPTLPPPATRAPQPSVPRPPPPPPPPPTTTLPRTFGHAPPAIQWSGLRVLFYVMGQQHHHGWIALPLACHDGHDWLVQSSCLARLPPHPTLAFSDGRTIVAGEPAADDMYAHRGLAVTPDDGLRSYAVYASEGAPEDVRLVDCGLEEVWDETRAPPPLAPFASDGLTHAPAEHAALVARLGAGQGRLTSALRGDFDGDGRGDRLGMVELRVEHAPDAWFAVFERRGVTELIELGESDSGWLGTFYPAMSQCLDFDANGAIELSARYGGDSEATYHLVIPYSHRMRHVGSLGFGD